jgi:drug/metabolite transporter (DMT)-like permease
VSILARLTPGTRGILGVVTAMLMFAIMDSFAKDLLERYPTPMVVWARFASQMVLVFVIIAPALMRHLRTAHLGLQLGRSALHLAANMMFFLALTAMTLADASAVLHTAPLMITLFAALILGERVGVLRWTGVLVGLCGALIIVRPGFDVFQPAALWVLGACACLALFQITARIIGAQDGIWTTMFYSGLVGTVVMSAAVPFYWTTPSLADGVVLITFGWIGCVGHIALFWGLTQAPASQLAPYNYANFIWAVLLGLVIFGEVPDYATFVGSALILGAGLYNWHRERVRELQSTGAG